MTDIDAAALRAAHDEGWCLCNSSTTDWDAVRALLDEVDQLRTKVADLSKAVVVLSPSQYARLTESEDAAALGFTEDLQGPQIDTQGRA